MARKSEMNCEYALRDERDTNGSYITMCDCPGGCPYKKETTKTGRGIVGECTKIIPYDRNIVDREEEY